MWEYVRANVGFEVSIGALREDALPAVLHERFVNYVYSRLIVAGCFAFRKHEEEGLRDDDIERLEEALNAAVEMVVDVPEEVRGRIVYYLVRLCPRIMGKRAEPNATQRKQITRAAAKAGHRCYLCGRELHFPKVRPYGKDNDPHIDRIREKRTFTIEHLWSKARGGSRDRNNLGACCAECNNLKKHLISFADFALEQIITTASEDSSVLTEVSSVPRLALLLRQGGSCAMCETKLHDMDNETLLLARREIDQPYFFFNMMIVCTTCNDRHALKGVTLRA